MRKLCKSHIALHFLIGRSKGIRWMPWFYMAKKDVVRLRYVSGSRLTGFDPEISEWGNPIRVMSYNLTLCAGADPGN